MYCTPHSQTPVSRVEGEYATNLPLADLRCSVSGCCVYHLSVSLSRCLMSIVGQFWDSARDMSSEPCTNQSCLVASLPFCRPTGSAHMPVRSRGGHKAHIFTLSSELSPPNPQGLAGAWQLTVSGFRNIAHNLCNMRAYRITGILIPHRIFLAIQYSVTTQRATLAGLIDLPIHKWITRNSLSPPRPAKAVHFSVDGLNFNCLTCPWLQYITMETTHTWYGWSWHGCHGHSLCY